MRSVLPLIGKIRPATGSFVRIIAYPFAAAKVPPNLFTFLGIPLSTAAAYFISQQQFSAGFPLALLAVSIDLFDGAVARLQNKESLFGNYFEAMADKIVEIMLFIGCALLYPLAAICSLGFSMLASYAKPRAALVIIADNRDWPAIGEHAERMILLLSGIFLSAFSATIGGLPALEFFLWAIVAVTIIGSAQRILYAKKLIAEAERAGNVLPYLKKK